MGVATFEEQLAFAIPPAKMFRACVLENHNFFVKALPQAIQNVAILEGNGGPGTVKQVNFSEGGTYKYAKERIDAIDAENFTFVMTLFEGDAFGKDLEKMTQELKFEASPDGGSICKKINKYYPIEGCDEIPEEKLKPAHELSTGLLKAVEAYLLANPDA